MRDFAADGLNLSVSIAKSVATIDTLSFFINPTDSLSATGRVALGPYAYDGAVRAQIRDLSKFNALVSSLHAGIDAAMAGALSLDWHGKGDLASLRSTGELRLSIGKGKFLDARAINAAIDGSYSPEQLTFPTFSVTSSLGDFSAVIAARNNLLRVDRIAIRQGGQPLLSGSLAIPFDLRTPARPETLIPSGGPISANLVSNDITIEGLFPKGQAPVTGTGKVSITARGSIDQPDVRVSCGRTRARGEGGGQNLAPATLNADLTLLGSALSLKARLNQPSFSSVEIAGTLPLPLGQILRDRRIDPQSPIQLSVRVPQSPVSVITRFVPAIRTILGTVKVSVDVGGTIANPSFSGAALADLLSIRLADPAMPSISGFRADLPFAGNRLTFRQFGGNLSGGTFGLTGTVVFDELTNPRLDLRMVSKDALVLRNEAVTVRANSDVRVSGPLATASVTGEIGITQSRFFKQIEILPIELPGHPASPPLQAPPTNFSIDTPPLRDWKFALKIRTGTRS